jgi:hypothetical protein
MPVNLRMPVGLSRRGVSDLSRRDKRTQPGVSTPGIDKKMARPHKAFGVWRSAFVLVLVLERCCLQKRRVKNLKRLPGIAPRDREVGDAEGAVERDFAQPNAEPDLKRSICRPFRAAPWVGFVPGVKTPGLVLLSLRDKSLWEKVCGCLLVTHMPRPRKDTLHGTTNPKPRTVNGKPPTRLWIPTTPPCPA